MNKTDRGKPDNPYMRARMEIANNEPREEAFMILIKSEMLV